MKSKFISVLTSQYTHLHASILQCLKCGFYSGDMYLFQMMPCQDLPCSEFIDDVARSPAFKMQRNHMLLYMCSGILSKKYTIMSSLLRVRCF